MSAEDAKTRSSGFFLIIRKCIKMSWIISSSWTGFNAFQGRRLNSDVIQYASTHQLTFTIYSMQKLTGCWLTVFCCMLCVDHDRIKCKTYVIIINKHHN